MQTSHFLILCALTSCESDGGGGLVMKGSLCHSPPTAKRFSDEDVLITLYCGYGDKSLEVCWILCPFSRISPRVQELHRHQI